MAELKRITEAVVRAVEEINQTMYGDQKISMQPEAILYGPQGRVDSLTLTLLIVAVEQEIERSLNITVSLVDHSTGNGEVNPFESINSLAGYIADLIEQQSHA